MGTQITFQTLYGSDAPGPVCSVLRINDFTVLLDCGWDDEYDPALLAPVVEIVEEIDAVLISHPDPAHIGALPCLVGRHNLQAPVYATVAAHKMGQMFMYDQYLSRRQSADFDAFSLDDVDAAFQLIRQLKFQQQANLTGRGKGMSVTAFAAGHMVGGAIWQLLTPDEEQVVYAVHWNHRKDRHLRRADLDGRFSRPALLITDACSAEARPLDTSARDQEFLMAITQTLQADGNVLVPFDTAGRSLELALLLEQHWQRQRLPFAVVWLTPVAYSTLEFAKSQLEWMNQDVSDAFNRGKVNPFDFRHIKVCHSKEELWELPPGPRVVMASIPSLAAGMSLQLLVDWAPNPNNLIIFPSQAPEGSTAAILQQKPFGSQDPLELRLLLGRRVPLEGEELRQWQEKRRAELEAAEAAADLAGREQPGNTAGAVLEVEEEGDKRDPAGDDRADMSEQTIVPATEMLKPHSRETLIDGFEVPEGAAGPMFPDETPEEREWTEYGNALLPGELRRATGEVDEMDIGSDDEAEEEMATRVVSSEVVVSVRAQVATFDFDGLSDAHSVRTVLENLAPRHLLITHGRPQAKEALRAACVARTDIMWQIHVVNVGQVVDASSGSSSYKVGLSEELLAGLSFRNVGACRVAWLTAKAAPASGDQGNELPELVPAAEIGVNAMEGGVFVGDVKLSALRKALGDGGISSEFFSGMLLCQKRILVKSAGPAGQLVLEGPFCEDYYRIRDIVFSQYNIC